MAYYKSNALYEHLKEQQNAYFKFVSGNAWQLIYGDQDCTPLLLVFIVGVSTSELESAVNNLEKEAYDLLSIVAEQTNLPIKFIRFADDVDEIKSVKVFNQISTFDTLSMAELAESYGQIGLSVSNSATKKYLNELTSSAYHNWQRSSLGSELTVSDIDLWRIDDKGNPVVIFELKRSFIDLYKWVPYGDDYKNFRLISNICNNSGVEFKIVYNQRIKNPVVVDKIEKLKIFKVDFSKFPYISDGVIINLEEFI